MNCDQALEQISAMLDGELSGDAQSELNAHLVACPDCRALYEDWKAIQAGLLDGMEDPPEGFHDRVMAAVADEPLPKERNKPRVRRTWAMIAAAAAVAAIAILPQTNLGRMGSSGGGGDNAAPMMAQAPAGGAEAYSMEGGAALEEGDSGIEGRSADHPDTPSENSGVESAQENAFATALPEPIPAAAPEAPTAADYDAGGMEAVLDNFEALAQPDQRVLKVRGELPEGYAWDEDGTLKLPAEELPQLEAALTEAGISYDIEGGIESDFVLIIRLD